MTTNHLTPAAALAAAIEKLGKLHNLAEQLPDRIAEAEAEYLAAAGSLGFPLPGVKRGRTTGGGAGARRTPTATTGSGGRGGKPLGEATLAILDVLNRAGDTGATVRDIADVLSTTNSTVSGKLNGLEQSAAPRVRCDRTAEPPRWFLTGPVPELTRPPVVAAALDAAGVEAAAA